MTVFQIAIIYIFVNVLGMLLTCLITIPKNRGEPEYFLLPSTIYRMFDVNWFGAILLYILYFVTQPYTAIFTVIHWLCTVGRR